MGEQRFAEKYIKTSTIEQRLHEIAERRLTLEAQQQEIKNELQTLAVREDELRSLRPAPVQPTNPEPQRRATRSMRMIRSQLPKPKVAVVALLRSEPNGLAQKDIVDRLDGKVAAPPDRQRKAVTNILWLMKREGEVREEDGRIQLVLNGKANHTPEMAG